MTRIKSVADLRTEQLRLARRKANLEDTIRQDWDSLRRDFEPGAYARSAFFSGLGWLGRRIFSAKTHSDEKDRTAF